MASAKELETVEIAPERLENAVTDEAASLGVRRFFTIPDRDPFAEIDWETRDALIPGKDSAVFEQKGVEFPKFGRRRRRTSSPRSTSAAGSPRPSASAASSR